MIHKMVVDAERLRDLAAVALADGRKDSSKELKEIADRLEVFAKKEQT